MSATPKFATVPDSSVEARPRQPARISISDLLDSPSPQPKFWVGDLIPERNVTLLGAHGGTGKSMLSLQLAVCIAAGLPFVGEDVRQGIALFYSAEDPAEIVRWRLAQICRHLDVDPAAIAERLIVFDATDVDPALFVEISDGGIKAGLTTSAYDMLAGIEADVIIVDNASDAYDADENSRPRVRAFIRALTRLVKKRAGAVLLLAHIDKAAARGNGAGQGYSGSTAWHNSVRSRLYLSDQDGTLVLEHQKSNLGPKRTEPIRLEWGAGGVLQCADGGGTSGLIGSQERDAVVGLIAEFYRRGEYLPTSPQAPANAFKMLSDDPAFPPRLDRRRFAQVLRDAERKGLIFREPYRTDARKERERWAPAAPTAPTARQADGGTPATEECAPAPTPQGGIRGVSERTEAGASNSALPDQNAPTSSRRRTRRRPQ